MKKIGHILIMLWALCPAPAYSNEVSVNIGINLFEYPELEVVPGYPVYYAPNLQANYFFYDGDYWIFQDDNWYKSSWYDGPWEYVAPVYVPVFLLRIPVRYYRLQPVYFFGWFSDAPPRWGEHWGHDWEQHRHGWDKWDRRIHVKPAPLPSYQREYSGDRYPRQEEQQHELQQRHYRYQPRDPLVRQPHREQQMQTAPVQRERINTPGQRGAVQRDNQRTMPRQQGNFPSTRTPSRQREGGNEQRAVQREPRVQDSQGSEERHQGARGAREPGRGKDRASDLDK